MKTRKWIATFTLITCIAFGQLGMCATAEAAGGWGGALLGILGSWLDGGKIDSSEMRRQHSIMMDNFEQYMQYRMMATEIGMDLLRSGGVEVVQAESIQDEFLNGSFVDGLGETAKEMAKMPKYKFDGTSYKVFCDRLRDANDPELRRKAHELLYYINTAHKYRDRMNDCIGYIISKTVMANDYNRGKQGEEIVAIIRDAQYMKSYENAINQRGLDFNAMKREMDMAIKVN